ncbi:hypothetical protein WNY37_01375 [Henriciella sp. AS95]|uniref:hypothetical protein n=1 Tax=Henriciella sp. AS95 TaxID=3135782 RepID=UPI00316EAB3A
MDLRRFDALASYARNPYVRLISDELAWYSTPDEKLLGVLLHDKVDFDFTWVVFARDEVFRYRAVDVNASLPTFEAAYNELIDRLGALHALPNYQFFQGDAEQEPIDFFDSRIPLERQHSSYRVLVEDECYSPAKEIIEAMMRSYDDVDGNFIATFQANSFDARIWELYLSATFNELNFIRESPAQVPDFILKSPFGRLAVEATTVNPPDGEAIQLPEDRAGLLDYQENYIPIRLGQALRTKLNHDPPYWEGPHMEGVPFCIAIQDFHAPGSMKFIVPAITEYVFGFRHSIEEGKLTIRPINTHRYGRRRIRSGFFQQDDTRNVSAVIVNPQGTLTKFNRMGFMTGFGNSNVSLSRFGVVRLQDGSGLAHFNQSLDASYDETWTEGMVVLHNPNALNPLDPRLLPGANHEFVEEDGRIKSLLPAFHPMMSQTIVTLSEADE